jgi:hypothetical protein
MPMRPARIENMSSTLALPEVQPDANRFSDLGCGNAKAASRLRDSRRSGKLFDVVLIAIIASNVSAAINHVDDRVADNDDTIDHPNVDAAANMDAAAANGGVAADFRPHHTAAARGSHVESAPDDNVDDTAADDNVDDTA